MLTSDAKKKYFDGLLQSLGEQIAHDLFAFGSEGENRTVQRIQFMGGHYPDNEILLGGLCEEALARTLTSILSRHIKGP